MKKIASLLISFTLLFTQLAPLARATNGKIINPKMMTDFSMGIMLTNPDDPRWLSPESLEEMVNFLAQHPEMTHNPQIQELIRSKVQILSTHCRDFFSFIASQVPLSTDPLCDSDFHAQEQLLTIIKMPYEVNGLSDTPLEELLVVKEVPQQVLEEKNINNTRYISSTGNGIVDDDRKEAILKDAKELVRRHKPSDPKNEDYFLLEHADFSYLPAGGTDDIPAELKEFIRALNQATNNGVELDAIMEEAIRAYLDPQYKGAGIFPPSYLSLLFKLYMDKVTSFQKAWSYVEVNTPASSKCQGTKCDDISRFAMEALLMQPRFREQLSQEQWTSIDEIINYKLSEFEVGSDEYITETVRMMILKEGKEKVQRELEAIVEKAIADGETPENTILFAGAELLQMSSLTIAGEAIPARVIEQYLEREVFVETVRKVIFESATEELTASATKAITGVMGGTTASVAIPIAVIGLFTVGAGYALYDAYGFKAPDAKRHMINYVNREISNHASLTRTIPAMQGNTKTSEALQKEKSSVAETKQAPEKLLPEDSVVNVEAVPWDASSMGLVGSGSDTEMKCDEDPNGNRDGWGGGSDKRTDKLNDRRWWNSRFPQNAETKPFVDKLRQIKKNFGFKDASTLDEWISTMRRFRAANDLSREEQEVLRLLEKLNKTGIPKRKFVNSAARNNNAASYTKATRQNGEWVAEAEIATKVPSRDLFDIFDPGLLESIKEAVCSADSVIDIIQGKKDKNGYLRYSSHERGGGHIHYIRQEEDYICNQSIKFDDGDDFIDLARLMLCN